MFSKVAYLKITKLSKRLICTLLVPSIAYAELTELNASTVEVLEGQELLIYPKSNVSLSNFKAETASKMMLGGNVKFLSSKIAVAGLGASSNVEKKIQKSTLQSACDKIKSTKIGCEINQVVKLARTPNDSFWSSLYGLRKISADSAWNHHVGSRAVKVAVIDTGVDYSHVDLAANIDINTGELRGSCVILKKER